MDTVLLARRNDHAVLSYNPQLNRLKIFFFLNMFLLITDYIMPQYFGLDIGFDLTCTRIGNILLVGYFVLNPKLLTHFCDMVLKCKLTIPFALYLIVALYTMVLRADINAFFMVFLEVLTLYMLIYAIRYSLGVKRAIKWAIYSSYFFGLLGLVDYVLGQSLMLKLLQTVPTGASNVYRSGQYRIMGPCGHPLGYGLYIILLLPMSCIDFEKKEVFLFKRPILLVLLLINVFLTGSRSTLGIVLLECFLIFIFSNRKNVKKTMICILIVVIMFVVFLLLFHNTKIGQYAMMQISSVVDQFLGTDYAAKYGAETDRLEDSENYRKVLPLIFTLDWLNPFLGRGVSRGFGAEINGVFVQSIDNYYVQQYIKYAYPGMIAYILVIITTVVTMCKGVLKYKSSVMQMALVGTVCYFINLWWVDALQTLKYEYIIIAIFYAAYMVLEEKQSGIPSTSILNSLKG